MLQQPPQYTVEIVQKRDDLEARLNELSGHGAEIVAITHSANKYTVVWKI